MPDEPDEVLYYFNELYRLMWCVTWDHANPQYWMLEPEEIFAELCEVLVRTVGHYGGNGKPPDEMKRILMTCIRNHAKDLCAMTYGTHRSEELAAASLDDEDEVVVESNIFWISSGGTIDYCDVDTLVEELSEDAEVLVRQVLDPGPQFRDQLELTVRRKIAISPKNKWKVRVTPLVLRRAVGWPQARFDNAWEEVASLVNTF